MRILAIETSCDETAITIADFLGTKQRPRVCVRSNIVLSQVQLHKKFGGVVPNLAKREHQRNLAPILLAALKRARLLKSKISARGGSALGGKNQKSKTQHKIQIIEKILEREQELLKRFKKHIAPLKKPKIDAIAVTYGPGLAPALWVGVNFAKALSYLWGKPLIPINHMTGHLYSSLLQANLKTTNAKRPPASARAGQTPNFAFSVQNLAFPAIALLVSGGHTELVLMRGWGKYKIIGETLDDAAGEAFDKAARLLGFGYPGGPAISAAAEIAGRLPVTRYQGKLPRPMIKTDDYNFSFSGLKTAVLYLLRDYPELITSKAGKAEVAKEFQNAVVDVLVAKTIRAAKAYRVKTILLGGGVAANLLLRAELAKRLQKELPKADCLMPEAALTGDNALMIAFAAFLEKKKPLKDFTKLSVDANARLNSR